MFWLRHRNKLAAGATLVLLSVLAYAFRTTTFSTRITNRAMLVGQYVVVFPVCESNTLSGMREYFPTEEPGRGLRC